MNEKTMQTKKESAPTAAADSQPVFAPEVDVAETTEALILTANLPGVDASSLTVETANGVLSIEATAALVDPEGAQSVRREFALGRFRRSFELGEQVEAGAVTAKLSHGVLRLVLPKRAEVKPRRVAVEA